MGLFDLLKIGGSSEKKGGKKSVGVANKGSSEAIKALKIDKQQLLVEFKDNIRTTILARRDEFKHQGFITIPLPKWVDKIYYQKIEEFISQTYKNNIVGGPLYKCRYVGDQKKGYSIEIRFANE